MTRERASNGDAVAEEEVSIALSDAQVEQVIRAVEHEGGLPGLQFGLEENTQRALATFAESPLLEDVQLSRSVLLGLLVLACFAPPGTERRIKDIAEQLGLSTSTTHRYIRTFVAVGLLQQNPLTREYALPIPLDDA